MRAVRSVEWANMSHRASNGNDRSKDDSACSTRDAPATDTRRLTKSPGSNKRSLILQNWRILAGGFVTCLVPLSLLFDLRNTFYTDWFNHLWAIEYFGEYLKWHRVPPDVFISTNLVGVPMPIFYAGKFYALAGCLSALIGSAVAFRATAIFVMLIQFVHVERAIRCVNQSKWLSFATALIVSWAIYPLTDLYNRSALTEFIAIALLNAAICSLFVLLIKCSLGQRSYYDAVAAGLLYAGAAVTHPLTALFGCTFILTIGIGSLLVLRRSWLIMVGVVNTVLITMVLAPWCYCVLKFSGSIPISNPAGNRLLFRENGFFRDTIDSVWSRLSPVPVDLRSISKGVLDVSTPYLDAQIILPLVLLAGILCWFWFKSAKRICPRYRTLLIVIFSLSTGLASLFFAVSVHPSLSARFNGLFDILQFPYRLTAYVNLALLSAAVALAGLIDWDKTEETRAVSRLKVVGITLCVTISLCALVVKLIHANAVNQMIFSIPKGRSPDFFWRGPRLLNLPWTSYGQFGYSVLNGLATSPPKGFENKKLIDFLPGDGSRFGMVGSITIELLAPTLVVTNVQPFPWNVLIVDGKPQLPHNLVTVLSGAFDKSLNPLVVAIPLNAGWHVLQYDFAPKPIWRILNVLSWIALILWIVIWALAALVPATKVLLFPAKKREERAC